MLYDWWVVKQLAKLLYDWWVVKQLAKLLYDWFVVKQLAKLLYDWFVVKQLAKLLYDWRAAKQLAKLLYDLVYIGQEWHRGEGMVHDFRRRLVEGELLLGTMVTIGSAEVGEILGRAGFDWLFLDGEHSVMGAADWQRVMQGAGREMPCLVRLPVGDEVSIKKALDAGAAGVIVPMVQTAEQAIDVVRWAKYAPAGERGVGLGRASGYGHDLQGYLARANEETAVVVQAEHIRAVENIEAIVRVEGVDAVLIGPYDLSASMGLMGQVAHPDVQAAIGRVAAACLGAGTPLGIFGVSAAAVMPSIERGYTLIVAGVDTLLLGGAAREMAAAVRG